MNIQILRSGHMVNAGHHVIKILSSKLPIVDLLVRESIQNSLDAGMNVQGGCVEVDFVINEFDKKTLNNHIEMVGRILNDRITGDSCKFLAVRDSGTSGLTGKLKLSDITSQDKGNFYKLVYAIGENQTGQGAGGAWGLGKTIFYQLGIGLVFYYSRIKDEDTGKYESRLIACMIEDETKPDTIIPAADGVHKSGIAWWGECADPNTGEITALTDEGRINEILKIFNIEPYEDNETGTTVIVPYINEEKMLDSKWADEDGNEKPTWRKSLTKYIAIATERWYFPRLNNPYYRYGKYLRVKINSRHLTYDDMPKAIQAMQGLYNRAANPDRKDFYDFLSINHIEYCIDSITIKKKDIINNISGYVASIKVSNETLGLLPPSYHYDPFDCFNVKRVANDSNSPLLAYVRRPGMIVTYVQKDIDDGAWLHNVLTTDSDTYILAVYVLNSKAQMTIGKPLEEYVRSVEESDHNIWIDKAYEGHQFNILERVKRNTSNALKNRWNPKPPERKKEGYDGGHSTSLGSLLLPRGNGASGKATKGGGGTPGKKRNLSASLRNVNYQKNRIILQYEVKATSKIVNFEANINISSESGDITPSEWENNMMLTMPFSLDNVSINVEKVDGKKVKESVPIKYEIQSTDKGYGYGFKVPQMEPHDYVLTVLLSIELNSHDVVPHVVFF